MSTTTKPRIVREDVLDLLKKGYTRYEKDNKGFGSIEAHYGLSGAAVKRLFLDPTLKQRKTILPKDDFELVSREEESANDESEAVVELLDKMETLAEISAEAAEPVLPEIKDDVVGLEQAKVVVAEIERLASPEGTKSGVPDEETKDTISKDELFS